MDHTLLQHASPPATPLHPCNASVVVHQAVAISSHSSGTLARPGPSYICQVREGWVTGSSMGNREPRAVLGTNKPPRLSPSQRGGFELVYRRGCLPLLRVNARERARTDSSSGGLALQARSSAMLRMTCRSMKGSASLVLPTDRSSHCCSLPCIADKPSEALNVSLGRTASILQGRHLCRIGSSRRHTTS